MAYNYGYSYAGMGDQYGNGGYQPMSNFNSQNQQALNPYYQAQIVPMINNQRFNAFFVNDYSEVKNAIVSADGKPSLFMMNDKDIFYIKKIGEDGRTTVKAFQFTEYEDNRADKKQEKNKEEGEVYQLKEEIKNIKEVLDTLILNLTEGGKKNEQSKEFTANDF